MASEAATNGSPATGIDSESPAQKLLAKHSEPHKVEIEEVVDEEDIAHPPPSASLHPNVDSSLSMSDVAKGKQKATADTELPKKPKGPAFDVKSEEAFPALGGPTPRAAAPASQTWGKMPAAIHTNGTKPSVNGGSNGTSRAPPPASLPSSRNSIIPGWDSQKVELYPQQINRGQLKKPLQEIIRDINKRSKANITSTAGAGTVLVFEGKGPKDAVTAALKELVQTICTKVGSSRYSVYDLVLNRRSNP
jgi:hypothetical protein